MIGEMAPDDCKTSIPGSNPGGASKLFNGLQEGKEVGEEQR